MKLKLSGTITLPLPVGTVGGSISIHPGAQVAHELLGHPSAIELAGIIASIGLAQNLAAVRALVTDGIQKDICDSKPNHWDLLLAQQKKNFHF